MSQTPDTEGNAQRKEIHAQVSYLGEEQIVPVLPVRLLRKQL